MRAGLAEWLAIAVLNQLPAIAAESPPGGRPSSAERGPSAASEAEEVFVQARAFFANLLASDAAALVEKSELPFYLEGQKIAGAQQLRQEWAKNFANKRIDLLTLYGIEVLTPAEMEKKYGRPPARLASMPWQNPRTYLAVANLSSHAAIAIFHRSAGGWRAIAYTD
jgi:hypothetical protein